MPFSTPAGKLHGLRRPLLYPSSRRPLNSNRSFVVGTPPPNSLYIYESRSLGKKKGERVPRSPKVCRRSAITGGSLAELWRAEVPLQTRFATSFESQLLAFFSQIPSLSRTEGDTSQQNTVLRFTSPPDPHFPSRSPAMWLERLEPPPGSGVARQRRHPERSQGNRAHYRNRAQKQHVMDE